jgi:hypothetical protein
MSGPPARSVVTGAGAVVVHAALVRHTARPARNFGPLSAVVFLLMLVPVFTVAPERGVVEGAGQAPLVVAFVGGAVEI